MLDTILLPKDPINFQRAFKLDRKSVISDLLITELNMNWMTASIFKKCLGLNYS